MTKRSVKETTTLLEFAKDAKRGKVPWLKTIPEFAEVLAGAEAGVSTQVMRRWLLTRHDTVPAVGTLYDQIRRTRLEESGGE